MIVKKENNQLDKNYLSVGDKVWGYHYRHSENKEGVVLKQVPVFGVITAGDTEAYHNRMLEIMEKENISRNKFAQFFTPFKKNGKGLAWSKSVRFNSRKYAETEEDAIKLYNDLIRQAIKWHQDEILRLQEEMVIR